MPKNFPSGGRVFSTLRWNTIILGQFHEKSLECMCDNVKLRPGWAKIVRACIFFRACISLAFKTFKIWMGLCHHVPSRPDLWTLGMLNLCKLHKRQGEKLSLDNYRIFKVVSVIMSVFRSPFDNYGDIKVVNLTPCTYGLSFWQHCDNFGLFRWQFYCCPAWRL